MPLKFLFKVRDVEDTLTQVSESAMREAVGQASLDKALAFDPSITDRAKSLLQRTLDNYDMGIRHPEREAHGCERPRGRAGCAARCHQSRTRTASAISRTRRPIATTCCRAHAAQAAKEVLDAEAYRLQVLAVAQGETVAIRSGA